jgi:hypothetical protein
MPAAPALAAEPEQRDALDVRPQSDPRGQSRIDCGHRDTGAGHHHDGVHLLGCNAGRVERRPDGSLAEVHSDFEIGAVGLGEPGQLGVAGKG